MNARILLAALLAVVVETIGAAHGQTFPSKPIRIVVPFPPGGAADITSRVLSEYLAKGLGQTVLVENRPGGSTIIGSEVVARSPADGPALVAVTGGHITMMYGNATEIAPSVKNGKLRAIVVTSAERADVLPDVPTMREAGYPELEATNWSGLVVPAATPPSVIARLSAELMRALRSSDIQEKFRGHGMSPAPSTSEQFGAFLQSEAARYGKVVREAGVKAE